MSIVREQLDLCNSLAVLLEMGYQFTGPYFEHSDVTLHTARANELATGSKTDGRYSAFVCVVNLPEYLTVINAVGSDLAVGPPTDNNFIGENGAQRHDADTC
jgi:hypothetical protein